jgi:hypothetical protein
MPNRNGYLPLGQDDQDIPEQDQDQQPQSKDAQTRVESYKRHVTVTVTEQEQPQGSHHITINSTSGRQQRPLSSLQDKARRRASSTSAASQTTAAAPPLSSPRFSNLNETTASASASSSTAPTGTSPSATFQRTLRGLQDQYSPNNSSFNDSSPSQNGKAGPNAIQESAAEGTLEDRQNRRSRRASASADLGFLRLRQHPHTTESGPRGIEKAQKRQVLRDIRPDPHNLPEELLREQARSEAAVDAISRGAIYHQQDMGRLSPLLPNSPGFPGVGGSPGLSPGTSAGSGTGAGPGTTGIPAAGGNRERSSKWRRRLRRLTRPRSGPENRQQVFHSSVFTPVRESVIDGQVRGSTPTTPKKKKRRDTDRGDHGSELVYMHVSS